MGWVGDTAACLSFSRLAGVGVTKGWGAILWIYRTYICTCMLTYVNLLLCIMAGILLKLHLESLCVALHLSSTGCTPRNAHGLLNLVVTSMPTPA